ncbi:helix-turn-helix transcriptional regulator [Rubrivivax albus]|uniref:AlpA family phage regulatory protein n=1 Tax=Rubrivivax albus TaxID=2499835 RepID=A0A3S2X3Q4_9BURK|nr:AlpA family phage regulatory protein [Rubrivivax albus]RVT53962.1 AlpA family phage regulatory protein [Rubrivivax albus]
MELLASAPAAPAATLLTLAQVERHTGLKKTKLYDLIVEGSFPRQVRIGSAARWVESEVSAWINARIADRDATPDPRSLLKASEIAPLLGVSVSTIEKDRKAASPRIPVVWVGPHARYDIAAVRAALAVAPRRGKSAVVAR